VARRYVITRPREWSLPKATSKAVIFGRKNRTGMMRSGLYTLLMIHRTVWQPRKYLTVSADSSACCRHEYAGGVLSAARKEPQQPSAGASSLPDSPMPPDGLVSPSCSCSFARRGSGRRLSYLNKTP